MAALCMLILKEYTSINYKCSTRLEIPLIFNLIAILCHSIALLRVLEVWTYSIYLSSIGTSESTTSTISRPTHRSTNAVDPNPNDLITAFRSRVNSLNPQTILVNMDETPVFFDNPSSYTK